MKRIGAGARRGAAAVEFAIILPLLMTLLFGIIEFSIILYDKAMITNASREGARAGIVYHENPSTGNYEPISEANIISVVNTYLSSRLITFGGSAAGTTTAPIDAVNGRRTVTVTYRYTFLVLPNFVTGLAGLGGGINLTAQTIMRME